MRIKAPISQADVLAPLKGIIEFTDEEPTTIVGETSGPILQGVDAKENKGPEIEDEAELLDALVEEEEVDRVQSIQSGRLAKAMAAAEEANLLAGKFVNLTDLIPPLPDKGSFEVESIKKSQYFFS